MFITHKVVLTRDVTQLAERLPSTLEALGVQVPGLYKPTVVADAYNGSGGEMNANAGGAELQGHPQLHS